MNLIKLKVDKFQHYLDNLIDELNKFIEINFFKKYTTLKSSGRFVFSWIFLVILLITVVFTQNFMLNDYYQTSKFSSGGSLSLGVTGLFTNANPIYANSSVDSIVSHLLFASLFKYNNKNQLVGDLAQSYTLDSTGKIYTVKLRPNIFWQDDQPITASDVVFTYNTIEDPNSQSPYASSFQSVSVKALNSTTVSFTLPDSLASFIYSLTTGILPQHILNNIPPIDMSSVLFNTANPIGSGPFKWEGIEETGNSPSNAQSQIDLLPNNKYYGGSPQLSQLIIKSYSSNRNLIDAYNNNQVYGAIGLNNTNLIKAKYTGYNFIYTAGTYVFFKVSTGVLSDLQVRKSIIEATNINSIVTSIGYPTLEVVEPLLINQLAFQRAYQQYGYNLSDANNILTQDGYILAKDGYRYKNGQELTFSLTVLNSDLKVAYILQSQWRKIGVKLNIIAQDPSSFNLSLQYHQYDALLNSISIGVDPDVFVYWNSSQINNPSTGNLNYSEFSNKSADLSLEEGRTRLDPALRVIKYQDFLKNWQQQVPAIGLYQPRLLFISHSVINNLSEAQINTESDILNNVSNWQINTVRQTY